MAQISRNELCRCGSRIKYKKCCLAKDHQAILKNCDAPWINLRRTEAAVTELLTRYMKSRREEARLAITTFLSAAPDIVDIEPFKKLLVVGVLQYWSLYDWIVGFKDGDGQTVATRFLAEHESQLSQDQITFIEATRNGYYSFYLIVDVFPEQRVVVQDIFLSTVHVVNEHMGSKTMRKGQILFARLLRTDTQIIFLGIGQHPMAQSEHRYLIEVRQKLKKKMGVAAFSPSILQSSWTTLFEQYLFILHAMRQPPRFTNSDGDLMEFHTVDFTLHCTPDDALERLCSLGDSEQIETQKKKWLRGEKETIIFDWIRYNSAEPSDNVIMGTIEIGGPMLRVEVNSKERSEKFKRLASELLCGLASFDKSTKAKLRPPPQNRMRAPGRKERDPAMDQLLADPAVQEQIRKITQRQYNGWADKPIPALNHLTPREAAKTPIGRELLEGLFLLYESEGPNDSPMRELSRPDTEQMRKEIGLL